MSPAIRATRAPSFSAKIFGNESPVMSPDEIPDLSMIMATPLDIRYPAVFAAMLQDGSQNITLVYVDGGVGNGIDWLVALGGNQGGVPFTPKEARNIATRFERDIRRHNLPESDTLFDFPKDVRAAADEAMDRNRRRLTPKDVTANH